MVYKFSDVSLPTLQSVPEVPVRKMSPWTDTVKNDKGKKLLHGRPEFEEYRTGVGRAEPSECSHSQFLDKVLGRTATCLDCGHEIRVGIWDVVEGGEVLSNSDLSRARHTFHKIWGIGPWANRKQGEKFAEYVDEPNSVAPAI